MAEETTKRTIANFNSGVGGKFPLDTEGLMALQDNERLLSAIGALGGNLYILSGCTKQGEAGYVFVKDADGDYPLGEVLRVEGGAASETLHLVKTGVDVTAEGNVYKEAYTTRHLEWGTGTTQYNYSDFKTLVSVATMMETIASLQQKVKEIQPEAVGTIKMWPSAEWGPGSIRFSDANSKWKLCDGSATPTGDDYTVINSLVGDKLPDMRGRFVVGYEENHSEYGKTGNTGGATSVALTIEQMPRHSHQFKGFYESKKSPRNGDYRVSDIVNDSSWTELTGGHSGAAWGDCAVHENRPPYIVMAYIIKVKD